MWIAMHLIGDSVFHHLEAVIGHGLAALSAVVPMSLLLVLLLPWLIAANTILPWTLFISAGFDNIPGRLRIALFWNCFLCKFLQILFLPLFVLILSLHKAINLLLLFFRHFFALYLGQKASRLLLIPPTGTTTSCLQRCVFSASSAQLAHGGGLGLLGHVEAQAVVVHLLHARWMVRVRLTDRRAVRGIQGVTWTAWLFVAQTMLVRRLRVLDKNVNETAWLIIGGSDIVLCDTRADWIVNTLRILLIDCVKRHFKKEYKLNL